ncbi:MAG TPA: DoxX family protein, partial [Gammaproteobacteria bacterium]|nr:DoxX family protein [Gammaproteobacteria bacterium]
MTEKSMATSPRPLMMVIRGLDRLATWFPQLFLRALVGWEFFESGLEKFRGDNWFADVAEGFPFPFNALPVELNWFLATWVELVGGVCIWLGLATRFWALSLVILTVVAIAGVHWPAEWNTWAELWKGYAITDRGYGNFKLPLILLVMLVPLVFAGPGRASIDHFIRHR